MSMTWRDGVPQQAQDDLDSLLDLSLAYATHALTKFGEIRPYATVVTLDGETRLVSYAAGADDLTSKDISAGLINGLRSERDSYRAVAISIGVWMVENKQKAVRVCLEHRGGPSLAVDLPYSIKKKGAAPTIGDLVLYAAARNLWSDEPTL